MQVILLGQKRDSNYVDLVEFCSSRGIKLVEEKITLNKVKKEETTDTLTSIEEIVALKKEVAAGSTKLFNSLMSSNCDTCKSYLKVCKKGYQPNNTPCGDYESSSEHIRDLCDKLKGVIAKTLSDTKIAYSDTKIAYCCKKIDNILELF